MNQLFANDLTVVNKLNDDITLLTVGSENALINGTERIIGKSPADICRNAVSGTSGSIYTLYTDNSRSTGRVVIVLRRKNSMIEFTGRFSGGNENYTVNSSTFRTVGRNRTHGSDSFTFTLGYESG